MTSIINRLTGKYPTALEMAQLKERATVIWRCPYASPEQIEWATEVYPEGIAEIFPTESYRLGRMSEARP